MMEYFEKLKPDYLFWFCALTGSGLFIIQFLLSLIGAGEDNDSSMDAGKVQWLSKQAVTGFLMMFGFSALTCKHEFEFSNTLTITLATCCGIAAVFVLGYIFKVAKKLHSSGNAFKITDLIGKEATVYQRIPKDGIGKISITLHNLSYEIDAVADDELPSFVPVKIIKQKDDTSVVVAPLNNR